MLGRKRNHGSASSRWRVGDATKYFKHAKVELKPGIRVFGFCRESNRANSSKLLDQDQNLSGKTYGATYVGSHQCVCLGYEHDYRSESWVVEILAARKKALKLGATHLLMETVSRGVRSPLFNPKRGSFPRPTERQLKALQDLADPLILVTDLHPSATSSDEAGYRSKRGQRIKKRKGGRPNTQPAGYKKELRLKQKPQVLKLHRRGLPQREIARRLELPRTTIQRWISEC